jgi:hypothetical protein
MRLSGIVTSCMPGARRRAPGIQDVMGVQMVLKAEPTIEFSDGATVEARDFAGGPGPAVPGLAILDAEGKMDCSSTG